MGHLLSRGKLGTEAFDVVSLGRFPDQKAAAAAVNARAAS
jgi:hypothetical protein